LILEVLGDTQQRKTVSLTIIVYSMTTEPTVFTLTFLVIAMVEISSELLQKVIRLFRFEFVWKAVPRLADEVFWVCFIFIQAVVEV